MRFAYLLLTCAFFAACSSPNTTEPDPVDAAADAPIDLGAEVAVDTASDTLADTKRPIDAREVCEACVYELCPEFSYCESAVLLEPGKPRLMQDTALGGRGDCAASGSGLGGPTVYYLLEIPAGKWARVVASSLAENGNVLVRVLPDCYALNAEESARSGKVTEERATLCLRDEMWNSRRIVLAVSRYSGEFDGSTVRFDLSVEIVDPAEGCSPG